MTPDAKRQPTSRSNLMSLSVCIVALVGALVAAETPAQQSNPTNESAPEFWSWAATPPMGWNSWDCFATTVTEEQTKAHADYMAEYLAKHGWQYVVVDIQWYEPGARSFNYRRNAELVMDQWGRLLPAPNRFPSATDGVGFKALAKYVHDKGLKFGVHLMRGIPRQAVRANTPVLGTDVRAQDIANTQSICPWNPDMYGVDMTKPGAQAYYDSVFKSFAEWGVDYVKVDDISRPYHEHEAEIEAVRHAVDNSGRPMVLSLSPGETALTAGEHVMRHANLWRISDDFWDNWPALYDQFERLDNWTPFRGPGYWPDADMLPLGMIDMSSRKTNFTPVEQYTLMSLWAIVRSPLMFGGDMTKMDDFTLSLLTNDEVLAVNQHSTNNRQLFRRDRRIAWAADVPNSPDKYLAVFNARGREMIDMDLAIVDSGTVSPNTPGHAVDIDVDVTGGDMLVLMADNADGDIYADHVAWVKPRLVGPEGELKLTEIEWQRANSGWREAAKNRSPDGDPIRVEGETPTYGIGTHATSSIEYEIPPGYTRFKARAALDDGGVRLGRGATVRFLVFKESPFLDEPEMTVSVPLAELGFDGPCRIRDLWKHEDLGVVQEAVSPTIATHGSVLYRVSPIQTGDEDADD